jgi:NAD(P)-dependent dehydrogenase (short-subunit alcohol dehydrogenase family)
VLGNIISKTLLDPWKMLPLLVLSKYTSKGRDLSTTRPNLQKALQALTTISLLSTLRTYLDHRILNNNQKDPYNWNKEVIILTGGSAGIGRQIAQLLGSKDIKVAILDITPPDTTTSPLPNSVRFYSCDITNPTTIATTATTIRTTLGRPTILINNAGICTAKTILSTTPEQTRHMFDVNTLSHYYLAQEFLPDMINSNHGMVVTVASQAGYTVTPNMVDYSASKAAAIAFHEGLAAELVTRYQAPRVRTVLVTQGFTKTALIRDLTPEDTWFNPLLAPETVAERVVGQVLKGESGHILVPGSAGWVSKRLRGMPGWFQHLLRCRLERLMRAE